MSEIVARDTGTCGDCGEFKVLVAGLCGECRLGMANERVELTLPVLHEDALHGVAGAFVRTFAPYSEAHPAALLGDYLATAGAMVGRVPGLYQGQMQRAKLQVVVLGMSGKARKGSSHRLVKSHFAEIDSEFVKKRCISAQLGSGEGVLELVRDPTYSKDGDLLRGSDDQRLCIYIAEMSAVFKVGARAGSVLTEVVRQAFDDEPMAILRREDPAYSTNHHVSIVGNTVGHEFFQTITSEDINNGTVNRCLFILGYRVNRIPRPVEPPDDLVQEYRRRTKLALESARRIVKVTWSDEAGLMWDLAYEHLTEDEEGPLGAMTARADTHPARLAMMYALLDGSPVILIDHLKAGLALWDYCNASLRYGWARWGGVGAQVKGLEMALAKEVEGKASRLLSLIDVGQFVGKTAVTKMFSKNVDAKTRDDLMKALCDKGVFVPDKDGGGPGRPAEGWRRVK